MAETSRGTAIVGGRVVPVEGEPIEGGTVLLRNGKIAAVEGPGFAVPDGAAALDVLANRLKPSDVVLVKASRAAHLEGVAAALEREASQ